MEKSQVCAESLLIRNSIEDGVDLISKSVDSPELSKILSDKSALPKIDTQYLRALCSCLYTELSILSSRILESTQIETAFNRRDCLEVVQSCLDYVKNFPDYFESLQNSRLAPIVYDDTLGQRTINEITLPWGTIATILPQSAFLFLSLTCLLNGLATGNRVILRAPTPIYTISSIAVISIKTGISFR